MPIVKRLFKNKLTREMLLTWIEKTLKQNQYTTQLSYIPTNKDTTIDFISRIAIVLYTLWKRGAIDKHLSKMTVSYAHSDSFSLYTDCNILGKNKNILNVHHSVLTRLFYLTHNAIYLSYRPLIKSYKNINIQCKTFIKYICVMCYFMLKFDIFDVIIL